MKIELTKIQKDFILNYFFINYKYAEWSSIGESLLESGSCIVPGTTCIWSGGIGNFIGIGNTPKNVVGCVTYTFNLQRFISSELFKNVVESYLSDLSAEEKELERKLSAIETKRLDILSLKRGV